LTSGVLSVLLGVTIIGGVLLGAFAISLGVRGLARRRATGGRAGTAVAGMLLGVLGLVIAGGTWLYVRDDVRDYNQCRRGSISPAQDAACKEQLRRGIEGR